MVNKWVQQIFAQQELEKQQVTELELQQEMEGKLDAGAQPVIIIFPNSLSPLPRLSGPHPLNNVYIYSTTVSLPVVKLH